MKTLKTLIIILLLIAAVPVCEMEYGNTNENGSLPIIDNCSLNLFHEPDIFIYISSSTKVKNGDTLYLNLTGNDPDSDLDKCIINIYDDEYNFNLIDSKEYLCNQNSSIINISGFFDINYPVGIHEIIIYVQDKKYNQSTQYGFYLNIVE